MMALMRLLVVLFTLLLEAAVTENAELSVAPRTASLHRTFGPSVAPSTTDGDSTCAFRDMYASHPIALRQGHVDTVAGASYPNAPNGRGGAPRSAAGRSGPGRQEAGTYHRARGSRESHGRPEVDEVEPILEQPPRNFGNETDPGGV